MKYTAWLMTLVGVLWALYMLGWTAGVSPISGWMGWLVALSFLAIGVGKLAKRFSGKRK